MDQRLNDIISKSEFADYEGTNFIKDEISNQTKKNQKKYDEISDPFDEFGYGVVAYFIIVKRLIVVYAVMCFLLIPVFNIYY